MEKKRESIQEYKTHKILWDFEIHTGHPIQVRRPDLALFNKIKRTFQLVYIIASVDNKVKIKEKDKVDRYLNFARELKKLLDMKVKVVVGELGTVTKCQETWLKGLEIRGRIETVQTPILLTLARILICFHFDFSEKPPIKTDMRNSE